MSRARALVLVAVSPPLRHHQSRHPAGARHDAYTHVPGRWHGLARPGGLQSRGRGPVLSHYYSLLFPFPNSFLN
jgi:hypothetical protein